VITKKALWDLIVVTAAAFSLIYAVSQQYVLVVFAAGLGLTWLVLEVRAKHSFGSIFFLCFLALAIVGSLNDIPFLIILLGLSTDLAAWDLSRFRARIADEIGRDTIRVLEIRHLQKLAVTASAGFLIALLPVFIHISIGFVIFGCVMVLAMITLRRSLLYFRNV
jgi:hypothetical protein